MQKAEHGRAQCCWRWPSLMSDSLGMFLLTPSRENVIPLPGYQLPSYCYRKFRPWLTITSYSPFAEAQFEGQVRHEHLGAWSEATWQLVDQVAQVTGVLWQGPIHHVSQSFRSMPPMPVSIASLAIRFTAMQLVSFLVIYWQGREVLDKGHYKGLSSLLRPTFWSIKNDFVFILYNQEVSCKWPEKACCSTSPSSLSLLDAFGTSGLPSGDGRALQDQSVWASPTLARTVSPPDCIVSWDTVVVTVGSCRAKAWYGTDCIIADAVRQISK